MADEEDTREVLFQDWEGPDKTGLTIEHTSGGELLVKEVKGESPAARSGKVYEGDQIVGATIYFENMSSEETAELLKTLNKHKVGLKLQNKGDKSPCYSPLSTPCRSPMGTLTWEGKSQFGASSPEIILSGDDEDYKRIYTKKIKPRLKSEDLAEGVDVRTERHSSTSSDGSTITTITRRITTYTVDMPSGIGEKLELSSPDFKGQRHESGDGSPRVRILHGSPTVKGVGEEGVFESCNVTYTGPKGSSRETHTSGDLSKTIIREGTEISKDLRFKGPKFGAIGHEGTKILRESEEQTAGSIDESEKQTTSGESKSTFIKVVTVGGSADAELTTYDENKRSASLSLPQEDIKFQRPSGDTFLHLNKGSSYFDVKKVENSADSGKVSLVTETNANTGYSSHPDRNSLTSRQTSLPSAKPKSGEKDDGVPTGIKVGFRCPDINTERKEGDLKLPHINTSSLKTTSQGSSEEAIKYQKMDSDVDRSQVTDNDGFHYKTQTRREIDTRSKGKADMSDSKVGVNVRMPEMNLNLKGLTIKGNVDVERVRTAEADKQDFESKDGFSLSQIETLSVKSKDQEVDVRGKSSKTANDMEIIEQKKNKDVKKYTEVEAPVLTIPSKSGTKMSMPDVDINLKGKKLKGEMDVSHPKIKTDIKSPKSDIKGPEVEVPKGEIEMPEIKMPTVNLKDPKVVDINHPKAHTDVKAPDVVIRGQEANLKGPKFNMPRKYGPENSMPDVDFNLKGPKPKGDMDDSSPKMKRYIKSPEIDIKGPEVDIEGTKGGLEMPKLKMPSMKMKGPKDDVPDVNLNLKGPKVTGDVDVKLPKKKEDLKGPNEDIEGPDDDIEGYKGGLKIPKFKMPSFGIKGLKDEDTDVHIKLPKADIDVRAQDVVIEGADLDIRRPDANLKGSRFIMPSISGPKISMPDVDFNLKGPKLKGDMNVSDSKIREDVKSQEIDIKGPEADAKGQKGGIEMPKIKMSSLNLKGSKDDVPDVNLNLKGLNVEGDVDVELPKIKEDLKGPEVDIEGVDVDMKGPNAKLKGPKFNMPSISGPKISMPDVDFNLKGPKLKGDMDVSGPKIKGDIKSPEIDIKGPEVDIEGPKGGFEMPKIKMPSLNLKGPKVDMPDVDINLKGPKVEGDLDVKIPKIKGDLKGPDVDIEGPDIDIEGPKGGLKMPKFKMPSFGLKGPKLEGPDVDINLPKADIDVTAPDVDIEGADLDIKGPNAKLKGPKFNMPSISGPKVSMPDVDFNLKGPKLKGDMDISSPNLKGDIKSPEIDIKGAKVKTDVPSLDIDLKHSSEPPNFPTIPVSKAALPNVDIKLRGSKLKGGFKGEGQFPKAELKDTVVLEVTPKKSKFKMPKVGFKSPKIKTSEPDIKLEHGDVNIKGKTGSCEGLDVDIGLSGSKSKSPKFKIPKFGLKGPKADMPEGDLSKSGIDIKTSDVMTAGAEFDVDTHSGKLKGSKNVDINLTGPQLKGDLNVSVPDVDLNLKEADIKGPKFEVEGPKGGLEMSKIKIPSFGIKLPQLKNSNDTITIPNVNADTVTPKVDIGGVDVKGPEASPNVKLPPVSGPTWPDLNINLTGPKTKGNVNVALPNTNIDIKVPKTEIKGAGKITPSEVDIKGPHVDLGVGKDGFEIPKIKMPSLDFKGPKTGSQGVDINLSKPKIDVDSSKVDFKAPKVKLPTVSGPEWDINLKGSNVEGKEINVNLPKTDIEVKGPKLFMSDVDMNLKAPDVDIKDPEVQTGGPKVGFKMSKVTLPSESEVDANFAKADFNIKAPEVNIKGPEFDSTEASLDVPDIDVKGKKGKFKLPKVKGKARKQEADIKTPEVDQGIDTQNIHVKGTNTKKPLFGKLNFPDVELDIKSSKLKGDGSLAEGFKSPDANVSSDSAKIYLEGPDVNVKGDPELSARTSGQSASGLQYPEGTILFPKIKVPKFGILQPKVEGQDVAGKGKSDATMGGKLDLEGGSGFSLSAKGKSASLDLFKKSKHRSSSTSDEGSLGVSSPSALSEAECGDISIDVGGTKVKGKKGKLKFGTFGGFGSKSKGSYEVTLGDDNEGEIEGSTDASVPLKKSRLSSSSSSDSGSKSAFRLPKLELSVSPKK